MTVVSVTFVIVIIVGGCDDRDRGARFRDDCIIGFVIQMTVTVVSVSIVIVIIVGGCDDRDRDDRFHDDCVIVIVTQMTVMIVITRSVNKMIRLVILSVSLEASLKVGFASLWVVFGSGPLP